MYVQFVSASYNQIKKNEFLLLKSIWLNKHTFWWFHLNYHSRQTNQTGATHHKKTNKPNCYKIFRKIRYIQFKIKMLRL